MATKQINTTQPYAASTLAESKAAVAGHLTSARHTFTQRDTRQERAEKPELQEQQSADPDQNEHGAEQVTGVLSAISKQGSISPPSHDQPTGNQGLESEKDIQDDHKRWTEDEQERQAAASAPYVNWMGEKVFPEEEEREA